ncbi:MAG: MarR family winged helix-turn-helix transcriptional regulator [Paracoccaceae bacterium]
MQLCFALYSANHAMAGLYRPMLSELGLTYPQYLVLLALWERDGQSVGELGKALMLESNTLTPLLKRMEAASLINRARSQQDERSVSVSLTDKGQSLEAKSHEFAACVANALDQDGDTANALREQIFDLAKRLRKA